MIDFDNLRTASLYINNQLLSRGLLRDGRGIDFADPGDTDYDLADTMGRIIGVVNDLILRRDRDAEHRESLSTTLRTLRADSLRQSDNFSRLQEKYTEAQRKISLHEAEDNAVRAQLKAAESTVQKLKEEAARAKRLVAETRASCANEVRKRDRQIDGLKKAAADAGRARGERRAPGITTIQVVGEVGAEEDMIAAGASTADENYDLRQETNAFLAQLAKGLNEENETLLALLRKTGDNLKEMSGWEKTEAAAAASKRDTHAVTLVASPEDISADIDAVLDHLRTMLTNPSFVPLEEVVVREQEIFRLRDGWEKMETRWRDTVHLIDGWHRRMAANGRPIGMEELKMGLRLSPIRVQSVDRIARNNAAFGLTTLHEEEEEEEDEEDAVEDEEGVEEEDIDFAQKPGSPSPAGSLHLVPAPGYEDTPDYEGGPEELDDSDAESSIFHEDVENDVDMDESEASEPNVEILQQSTEDSTSMPVPPSRKGAPLEESNAAGNRKPSAMAMEKSRKRSGELMSGNTGESDEAPPPPPHGTKPGQSPAKRLKVSAESQQEKPESRPNSVAFTNSDSSLDPSSETSVSKTSSKATTVKSTQSDVSVKKEAPALRKPATRATRAAASKPTEQPKKDIATTRPLTRQRPTRAIAATSSSSARTALSKPAESSRARAPPASTTSTDMPPPPRPNRSANASPHNGSSQAPPPPPAQEDKKKASPAIKKQPPPTTTTAQAEPSTSSSSSGSRCPAPTAAPTAPDSPTRSPGRAASRLPLPRNAGPLPPPQQSPLSMARIAAKLAASEREADAARVKAKLRAARLNKSKGVGNSTTVDGAGPAAQQGPTSTVASSGVPSSDDAGDPVKRDKGASGPSVSAAGLTGSGASYSTDENGQRGGAPVREDHVISTGAAADEADVVMSGANGDGDGGKQTVVPSPRKVASSPRKASPTKAHSSPAKERPRRRDVRSRADRVANRRRSTLNPWELQSLISGEVVPPSPRRAAQAAEQE